MEYIEEADYDSLIIPYQDAMANLMTRLDSLNNDYRRKYKNYPIHHMQERIKKKESIEEKLRRKGCRVSAEEARENLTDIAGIRIICYFEEDIYHVLERIKRQTDILILQERLYQAGEGKWLQESAYHRRNSGLSYRWHGLLSGRNSDADDGNGSLGKHGTSDLLQKRGEDRKRFSKERNF